MNEFFIIQPVLLHPMMLPKHIVMLPLTLGALFGELFNLILNDKVNIPIIYHHTCNQRRRYSVDKTFKSENETCSIKLITNSCKPIVCEMMA